MMSGYQKAANAHGSTYTVHADSAEACWTRAQQYLAKSFKTTPIVEVNDTLIQTAPAITAGSKQFIITRTGLRDSDSVRISVRSDYKKNNNYDIFGPVSVVEDVMDIAFHSHTGWESHNMPKTLVPGYVAGSPMEPEKEAPKEGSIWLGTSYGKRNWGAEIGARYKFIGASISFADLDNSAPSLPDYEEFEIPHNSYITREYVRDFLGWNLYGFWDVSENLALYGFGGYYYRPHVFLDQSTVTSIYYESTKETTYAEQTFGGGIGLHYGVTSWLLLGAGYSSINDGVLHVGGRF